MFNFIWIGIIFAVVCLILPISEGIFSLLSNIRSFREAIDKHFPIQYDDEEE